MAKATPLQTVNTKFGSKAKLVDQLYTKVERHDSESDAEFRERLSRVSNKKLLRLHAVQARLESDFGGSKARLVDTVLALKAPRQQKDADYRGKLEAFPITRLLDLHDAARRRG